MRYQVVTTRSVGNAPPVVVARTRRYNGALAEADRWLDSARANARKHANLPGDRVVEGPTGRPDEWAVVSLLRDGTNVVESVQVQQVQRAS